MEKTLPGDGNLETEPLYVVGIGASAGGLEALEHFFRSMPLDTGMAFVVIQHLSPDFKSLMDELLARHTRMTIVRVEGDTEMRPNTIYLLPPRKELTFEEGRLVLVDRLPDHQPSMPINRFFRALARERGNRAIAVVLSGTGTDGSLGLSDIYDAGGLVLVQDVESAKFDGMPRSALATGFVHAVLSPDEMSAALVKHVGDPESVQRGGAMSVGGKAEDLAAVFERIREAYGIDFGLYKPATITRRIERRLVLGNFATAREYFEKVSTDSVELDLLYKDLLIGVTRFFRDPEAFEVLRAKVIPEVLSAVAVEEDVRIWVPGCATGEEAYSLAMLFLEEFEARNRPANLKVFATDLHRDSLRTAAEGLFEAERLEMMPASLREKYFSCEPDGRYRVLPRLRRTLLVSPHNLIRDVPFNRIDLVSCRNLLIYFQAVAQTKALTAFNFALKHRSFLFLGPSESTGEVEKDFETLDRTWKIYRKISESRGVLDLRRPGLGLAPVPRGAMLGDARLARLHDQLLGRYMPPGVLVNEKREILHLFGEAHRFLHPPTGRANLDLVAMCDGELRTAVASSLQAALKRQERVEVPRVRVQVGGQSRTLKIIAEPFVDRPTSSTFVLLRFEELAEVGLAASPSARELDVGQELDDHVRTLEIELQDTRESLQTMVEELETTNEELQASNEELLASNEELQSTNEELHSVNEELYSVNAEHEQKIRELATTTADLRNLMAESHSGIIFTDTAQCIRMFTPGAAQMLNLLPQDVGRPIAHITSRSKDDDIFEDIKRVEVTRVALEKQISTADGTHFLRRIAPYHDSDKQPAGLVIAFVDVTELVNAQARARYLAAIVECSKDAIIGHDESGRITSWNPAATLLFGYTESEALGQDLVALTFPDGVNPEEKAFVSRLGKGESAEWPETLRRRRDGELIAVSATVSPTKDVAGRVVGGSTIVRDLRERKEAEQALRASRQRTEEIMAAVNAHAIVAITDVQGRITFANDRFCEISKYSREELLGQTHRIVKSGFHPPEFFQALWTTITRGSIWQGTIKNRAKDGTCYWVDATIVPLLDDAGRPRQYVAIRADVTHRMEAGEALRQQAEKLAAANLDLEQSRQRISTSLEEKEALLREIHHRVKNNMQVISSILKLQAGYIYDPAAQEVFKDCQGRIRTMALIHEKLYRSEGLARVDFKEYLESLARLQLRSQSTGGADLRFDYRLEEVILDIDVAIPLGLIANELLTNCLKHAFVGRRSGVVEITLTRSDAEGLFLKIKDNGVGWPQGFRVEDSPSLGMKLIKILTDQLGARSEWRQGEGTDFTIFLKEGTNLPISR